MADVTGPISSLPNSKHVVPSNTMCDNHPNVKASVCIQGETDSFGSEMHDLCQVCYDEHRKAFAASDRSGVCDWCDSHADRLFNLRDVYEGMSGHVYRVCVPCVQAENDMIEADNEDEVIDYPQEDPED